MKPGVSENAKTPYDKSYDNLYGGKKTLLLEFAKPED